MKDKPGRPLPSSVREQIRQFQAESRPREAMAQALEILLEELSRLRDALRALGEITRKEGRRSTREPGPEEAPALPSWWVESKPRILH